MQLTGNQTCGQRICMFEAKLQNLKVLTIHGLLLLLLLAMKMRRQIHAVRLRMSKCGCEIGRNFYAECKYGIL
jgi:hypothetical protein